MSRRRVLIADDEPLIRARLKRLMAAHASYEIVAEAADGDEATVALAMHRPDVVFLDIRMPGCDGLAVAARTRAAVVFVTAYAEHAAKAFELGAVDYLLKPIDATKVERALARVEERRPAYARRFAIRDVRDTYFVADTDIDWIGSAGGNYVRLHVGSRSHLLRMTIQTLSAALDPRQFVRVHRSCIVRIAQIARMRSHTHGEYTITLHDGTRLRASRTYGAAVRARIRTPDRHANGPD